MTDDLRREAEEHTRSYQARLDVEGWSDDLCIEILVSFAKAQRAAEVRAIQDKWNQQTGIADWWNWLDQRLKEWET